MNFLSIDSSTKYTVVSVFNNKELLAGRRVLYERWRSEGLLELVTVSLKKARCDVSQIDCFGVGIGPGSFTGLRIGLSTIKAFASVFHKPCVAFSSLEAIAFGAREAAGQNIAVCVDAKRSNFYCATFCFNPSAPFASKKMFKDALVSRKAFFLKLKKGMWVTGDGLCGLRGDVKDVVGKERVLPEKFWYPTPQGLMYLTQGKLKRPGPVDCRFLVPTYLYEKDCQVRR